ncbi:MT-A70-domain-containing protein [Acaromyces ingoldii]|uniref:MT-A70-domain-containing protein n=1 Tax=Acaromyces ingoldii TaxID=215250 RepID=A0A316YF28_9BASI|nr:MT-A70-domain-containing protein [Acaromyces ingoldii]PWN87484.1 MT-A70-domain-containing protein [Acaromyces ingoldii]
MAKESFIFLWVGSGASDGLERGREVLSRWGYRRSEDIVWVQTNHEAVKGQTNLSRSPTASVFRSSKQHCLMGIRGTVRRRDDTRFVHCNIDTDVIVWEGDADESFDARAKPPELMDLVENFCLGTRRLELFGRNRNLRRGWLTVGKDVGPDRPGRASDEAPHAYEKQWYDSFFGVDRVGATLIERRNLVPFSEEIDRLRPKSPHYKRGEPTSTPPTSSGPLPPSALGLESPSTPSQILRSPLVSSRSHQQHQVLRPGGAGFSGLGAGGPTIVSVPSGSENLSGPQASVLLAQAQAQAQEAAAASNSAGGQGSSATARRGGGAATTSTSGFVRPPHRKH